MAQTITVELPTPANDIAQEEITKQVAFLSRDITDIRFRDGGAILEFRAPQDAPGELLESARALAVRVQRSLRSIERKVAYRTEAADRDQFRGTGLTDDITMLGNGYGCLRGTAAKLYRYFKRLFEDVGAPWRAEYVITPTLIAAPTLAKCGYFESFPHNVTFACHLTEDAERIEAFRKRHEGREDLDDTALANFEHPHECLSPAVCYHVYHLCQNTTVPKAGKAFNIRGKCFRYESSNMESLRRMWDFTMSEVVFLGTREGVLRQRERAMAVVYKLLEDHDIAAEVRTASDPFFVAPDAAAKTYFQLTSETKFEISLMLPEGERIAAGSFNYHTDFFGRAFNCEVEGAGPMHSVCVAFGLERWVYSFLAQHGNDPAHWPAIVRDAPELAS